MVRKIIWALAAILTFIVFYYLIPDRIAKFSPFFISVAGALIFTFFVVRTLGGFTSIYGSDNQVSKTPKHFVAAAVPFTAMAMIFVFVINFTIRKSSLLKEDGEIVLGTIVDGSSVESIKGGIYNLTVKFLTKEGEEIIVEEGVYEGDFDLVHKGQEVPLIYYKKDAKIIRLLLRESDRQEYGFE